MLALTLFMTVASALIHVDTRGQYVVLTASTPIKKAVACTAIDLNMDSDQMCATPGFVRKELFPRDAGDFGGVLYGDRRIMFHGRTVVDSWPLVYVQLDEDVVRVPLETRERALAAEKGRASQLDVIQPVAPNHSSSSSSTVAWVVPVTVAAFLAAVILCWRARRRGRKSFAMGDYHVTTAMHQLVTGERPENSRQRQARLRREQYARDREWGVRQGEVAPRKQRI